MSGAEEVTGFYDANAGLLAERYEAVSTEAMLSPVAFAIDRDGRGRTALDVGAGTGRDAAWLAGLGYEVVAVEPSAGMRAVGAARRAGSGVRWLDDALPGLPRTHALGLVFDVVVLSAVWQHLPAALRPRAFRKLASLLRPGGTLIVSLRNGPSPEGVAMHPVSSAELEGLAKVHGLEILRVVRSEDQGGRLDVTWEIAALRMPNDGTGALPLVRGIVLSDGKSSTYKLGLLRAVARIAEYAPAAATPAMDGRDAYEIPLGLVALNWLRMYLPLVRLGLPQAPGNRGVEGLSFAKEGFEGLLAIGAGPSNLRIGAAWHGDAAVKLGAAMTRVIEVITRMPATHTRYPNGGGTVFGVSRRRRARPASEVLDVDSLRGWGTMEVPGDLWRAMSRFSAWIDPMLVAEWGRLVRGYADRMGLFLTPGQVEGALRWVEPSRATGFGRDLVRRLMAQGEEIRCVWTRRPLGAANFDVDHCLPWSVLPCGGLWNLMPSRSTVNRNEKRDRLPSAAAMAGARETVIGWWNIAYLNDRALESRFVREASTALPLECGGGADAIYDALEWRRLRLSQDQRVPEWTPRGEAPGPIGWP